MQITWIRIDKTVKWILLSVICCFGILPSSARGRTKITNIETEGIVSPNDIIDILANTVEDRRSESVRNLLLGTKAPNFNVEKWLLEPKEKFVWSSGKFTFLHFWSVDCNICVGELQKVCELAKRVKAKGGYFISIHSFVEVDKIVKIHNLLKDSKADFGIILDTPNKDVLYWYSKTFKAYGISNLPAYVTIGANGRILSYKSPEFLDWEKMIKYNSTEIYPDPMKEVRPLTVTPLNWIVDNAEPGSNIRSRFLRAYPNNP